MLKNSARNSSFNRSPISEVVFPTARSKFTRPGPRKKFRGSEPYVASEGLATICASDGKIPLPGVQLAGTPGSPQRRLLKLFALNQKLPGARGSSVLVGPTTLALG